MSRLRDIAIDIWARGSSLVIAVALGLTVGMAASAPDMPATPWPECEATAGGGWIVGVTPCATADGQIWASEASWRTLPACESDDWGPAPCSWDATRQGDGRGLSGWADAGGVHYVA